MVQNRNKVQRVYSNIFMDPGYRGRISSHNIQTYQLIRLTARRDTFDMDSYEVSVCRGFDLHHSHGLSHTHSSNNLSAWLHCRHGNIYACQHFTQFRFYDPQQLSHGGMNGDNSCFRVYKGKESNWA